MTEQLRKRPPARRPRIAALPLVAITLLCVTPGMIWASHHLAEESDPHIPASGFETRAHARVFVDVGPADLMLEYAGGLEVTDAGLPFHSLTAGTYLRVLRNLKAGIFYRLQVGVRHDDDWIDDGSAWLWADATGRLEHLVALDLSPRFLLGFMPGNWVASVKARYEYNLTTTHKSLLLRPGVTWFMVRDREPVLNLSAQYGTYLSLNFGDVPWYGHGPYLNALYHLGQRVKLDVSAGRQWVYWSESEEYRADFPAASYSNNVHRPWFVDLGMILNL